MMLSLNKVIRCLFPLRFFFSEMKTLIRIIIFLYIFTSFSTIYMIILHARGATVVRFLTTQSYCTMLDPQNPTKMWLMEIFCHAVYNILPLIVVSICNFTLIVISCRKSFKSPRKSTILSVLLVSCFFMGCTFPYSITRVILHFHSEAVSPQVLTFAYFFHMNEYWINAPIYILTNTGFRNFTFWYLFKNEFSSLERKYILKPLSP